MALRMTVSGSRSARLRFREMVLVHFGISRDAVRINADGCRRCPNSERNVSEPLS
jgi:hypothetical protein